MEKIDSLINRVLRRFWPEDAKGDRKVWFHSQNLNEDRDGNPKGLPYHGRCWLNVYENELRLEWNFWSHFCGVSVAEDGESGGLQLHAALPPVSWWFTVPLPKRLREYGSRNFFDISFVVEEGTLRWQFGGDQHSWSSQTPKWKHGHFNIPDFVLGERKYIEGSPEVHTVKIPMPEGAYDATVKLHEDRWERARWFPLVIRRATVDVPVGIPFEGKGENSWDCGEDCSYGFTGPAETLEQAIAKQVEHVLRNRRRYGGWNKQYPTPAARAVEVENRRREAAREQAAALAQAAEAAENMKPGKEPRA